MKYLSFFLVLLFATTSKAQLYITSYDDTTQIVYVCTGKGQNSVPVQYALINLNQSVPITIDSIVPKGDPSAFPYLQVIHGFTLGYLEIGTDGTFAPSSAGDDTLTETVYYNGQNTATSSIIYHARLSPSLAMYGYVSTIAYTEGANSFGEINTEEETDTLHDEMVSDAASQDYILGSSTSENGGKFNQPVVLRSCGGAVIDSIYELGDFSDFLFDPFPKLPYTMPGDDSLILNYEFTPKVLDTSFPPHHYLIFHSTDGHYLTWSFEYYVVPASDVSLSATASNGIRIFPNPASDQLEIMPGPVGAARLFDLLGRERMNANDDGTGVIFDVSHLEPGTYFFRLGNQSANIQIAR